MDIKEMLARIPDLSGRPAVALETTVLTHGMPYPQNVECALACEEKIRAAGAEPYTIGILNGQIHVGLTHEEIEALGQNHTAIKVSRKDIPYCLNEGLTGSTTVAATMVIANLAHIRVFATGGIGGVHRGYNETMDVSADLNEFARTPVNVVCAGPKAILDIPRTLEYLETQGVSVIGYQTDKMPLFYTRTSDYKLDIWAKSAEDVAQMIALSDHLGLKQGSLIVNPIPEEYSIDYAWMNARIEEALQMMAKDHITGKRVTPYLLDKLVGLTGGKSLTSNMALIQNNAAVAGLIAKQLSLIK
jgi:pseudouridine-5'-phosphate glycosidase